MHFQYLIKLLILEKMFLKDNDGYIDHSEFNEVMGDLMNE